MACMGTTKVRTIFGGECGSISTTTRKLIVSGMRSHSSNGGRLFNMQPTNFVTVMLKLKMCPSEKNEKDKVVDAKALYKQTVQKKFRFDHCWNLLRLQLKWLDVICKQKPSLRSKGGNFFSSMSSPSTSETPINLAEDDVPNTSLIHRPLGKNVKKRKMRDHEKNIMKMHIIVDLLKEMMERRKKIDAAYLHAREVELMKRLLNLEEERQQWEQVAYEVRIMTMDMSGMTPIAQEYYRRLRMRILQRHSGGV